MRILAFIIISLLAVSMSLAKGSQQYPVVQNSFVALDLAIPKLNGGMAWVDNRRVLFQSVHGGKKLMFREEGMWQKGGLFLWNTQSNEIEHYADGGLTCFGAGTVAYWKGVSFFVDEAGEITNYSVDMKGEWGKETPQVIKKRKKGGPAKIYNDYNCTVMNRPAEFDGRSIRLLLPEHGYLDFGTLVRPNGDRVETGLPDGVIGPKSAFGVLTLGLRYYPWLKSYVGMEDSAAARKKWSEYRCRVWWTLQPPEKAVERCLFDGPWTMEEKGRHHVDAIPTRTGAFVKYVHKSKSGKKIYKDTGGYVVTESGAVKVIGGMVWQYVVSLDGCRVAFTHLTDEDQLGYRSLAAVNVCGTEKASN